MARYIVTTDQRFAPLDAGMDLFGFPIASTVPGGDTFAIDVDDDEAAEAKLADLERKGLVVSYRPERTLEILVLPPSPAALTTYAVGDTLPRMVDGEYERIRERGRWGAGVVVGVLDTGLDGAHEAFRGKTLRGDVTDSQGHGSHVAGIAAGVPGFASDATIHSLNVLPGGRGSESGIQQGMRLFADQIAAQRVPAVANCSFGGAGASGLIQQGVRYMQQRGIVVVAAAGNGGGAPIGSPADAADLIVLACDRSDRYASFTDGRDWPHPNRVTAYGVDIVSVRAGGGYVALSGTSMAAPHIAGAAALLLAAGLTRQEVQEAWSVTSGTTFLGTALGRSTWVSPA